MAQCIQCSQELTEDFGLVECPSCNSVLFIDMDGQVSVSEDSESPVVTADVNSDVEPNEATEIEFEELEEISEPEAEYEPEEVEQEFETFEAEPVEEAFIEQDEDSEQEYLAEDQAVDEFVDEPSVIAPMQEETSADMNLSEFANQVSEAHGFLSYDLTFTGIDTAKIRDQFKLALNDPKFNWDADQILGGVDNGVLKIPKVDSVKAAVLINKVKSMSIHCSWEQFNVHQN